MELTPGAKLCPYEIVSPIGAGGMGEVFKARDTRLDRTVAVKVMPKCIAVREDLRARFEREARTVSSLNHPNICVLHDIGKQDGIDFMVLEYLEGETLAARIAKGPLPLDQVFKYATQIADALDRAHRSGVSHRDVKPANVMITRDGCKVLDFGLAKTTPKTIALDDATLTAALTSEGAIMGTPQYMAPEQYEGKEADARSDIFAFGCVLYEMVTGKRAFDGKTRASLIAAVLSADPAPMSVLQPVTPRGLERLVKRCLAKDPEDRYQSMRDVVLELRSLGESGSDIPAQAASLPHRKLPWAVAAVLAVAVAGLAFFAIPHFREEPQPNVAKFEFPPPEKGTLVETWGPPAVSPDGRRVAFRATVNGKSMLYMRDLDSLNARMLPGTENPNGPFWAPDSRQLAFWSSGKLMKIDVTGGPVTSITNASFMRGGTWNPDDVIVFNNGSDLSRVSAAGGTPTPVTELDKSRNETADTYPQFLPDGHHFLYLALSGDTEKSAIFVGDLQSKDKKLVLHASSNARYVEPVLTSSAGTGYLLFVRESALMAQPFDAAKFQTTGNSVPLAERVDAPQPAYSYFGSSRNGTLAYASGGPSATLQIPWYDSSGKAVGKVGKPADIQTPRLSPDGKMVAVDLLDPQTNKRDIWLYDLARGTEQRLTFADTNQFPVWSPDSLRVAYESGPDYKVMVKKADGAGQEELLEAAHKLPQDWTRDGRYLISATSSANPRTGNDLWALPLSDGQPGGKPVPLRETEFAEWHGRVSRDGRWLAYMSDESKRMEIYVTSFPSLNGHWQISVNGGTLPVWDPSGRELYFVGADDKMMAVETKGAPAPAGGSQFQAGVPQPLFGVRMGSSLNRSYDVSADGRFLIATPVEQSATVPMTVMLNWQAGLKK